MTSVQLYQCECKMLAWIGTSVLGSLSTAYTVLIHWLLLQSPEKCTFGARAVSARILSAKE